MAPTRVRHARRTCSSSKIRAWSVGDGAGWAPEPVRAWTAAMAAARKWPLARRSAIGVSGAGCRAESRNGAGTVVGARGW